jgi:hypothetical protein
MTSRTVTLIFSVCLLIVLSSAFALGQGLVLYLPFDGSVNDASGNGNNGIIHGNAKWVAGKYGQAMQFDGAAYVEVPDKANSGFDGLPGLTIEVWVKMSAHHDNGIVVKLTTAGTFWPCGYNLETWSDQAAYFGVNQDTGQWVVGPYPLNEWFHIAGVFDNGNELLYINGQKMGSVSDPSKIVPDSDLPVYIGCVDPTNYFFKGELDDIAIYNRALNQAEIQQDMSSISPAPVESAGKLANTWAAIKK